MNNNENKITTIISEYMRQYVRRRLILLLVCLGICWRFECIYHLIIHVLLNGSENISECRIIGVKNGSSFGLQVCQICFFLSFHLILPPRTQFQFVVASQFSNACFFFSYFLLCRCLQSSFSSPFWSLRWFVFFLQNLLTSSILARLNGSLTAHSRNRSEPTH